MTALVTESGVGLPNADSYCSVAEATAYLTAIGSGDDWDAVDDKEAALRKATNYLTQRYRGLWAGRRLTSTQALDWPRYDVPWNDSPSGWRDTSVIPNELKAASAELALKSDDAELLEDLGRETLSEKVDVLSITYAEGRQQQTEYASVKGWLQSLLSNSGNSLRIVRS